MFVRFLITLDHPCKTMASLSVGAQEHFNGPASFDNCCHRVQLCEHILKVEVVKISVM